MSRDAEKPVPLVFRILGQGEWFNLDITLPWGHKIGFSACCLSPGEVNSPF